MSFKVTAVGAAHEPILRCPNCNHEIRLTESLAAPLLAETRQRFQEQLASKDAEMARKVEALRLEREQLAEARGQVEEQVSNRLAAERNQLIAAEAKKARDAAAAGGRRRDATTGRREHRGRRAERRRRAGQRAPGQHPCHPAPRDAARRRRRSTGRAVGAARQAGEPGARVGGPQGLAGIDPEGGAQASKIGAVLEKAKTVGIIMAQVKEMTGWSKTGGFFGAAKRAGLTLTKDASGAYHAA